MQNRCFVAVNSNNGNGMECPKRIKVTPNQQKSINFTLQPYLMNQSIASYVQRHIDGAVKMNELKKNEV